MEKCSEKKGVEEEKTSSGIFFGKNHILKKGDITGQAPQHGEKSSPMRESMPKK